MAFKSFRNKNLKNIITICIQSPVNISIEIAN